MPKQAIVTMKTGVDAAVLSVSYNHTLRAGQTYTLPFDEFQKIKTSAFGAEGVIDTVVVSDEPNTRRGHDLTAENIAAVPEGAVVGRVEPGVAENDAFVLAQASGAVAAGDAVGWVAFGDTVATTGATFAGVALGAAADGEYVWVQVDGWVVNATGDAASGAGDLLAFDGAGGFTAATGPEDAVAVSLGVAETDPGVSGIFEGGVNLLRKVRRQTWARV